MLPVQSTILAGLILEILKMPLTTNQTKHMMLQIMYLEDPVMKYGKLYRPIWILLPVYIKEKRACMEYLEVSKSLKQFSWNWIAQKGTENS